MKNFCKILIGENIIKGNFAYNEIKSKAAEFNAEPFNIYDMHLLARLMLIEFGESNIQKALSVKWTQKILYNGIMA